MQQADLPVRDAVGGGEVVEAWALLGRGGSQPLTALEDRVSVVLRLQDIRRARCRSVVSRDRDREAADPEHARVRRPGAAVATLERRLDPEATSLQVDHQVCQRGRSIDALCRLVDRESSCQGMTLCRNPTTHVHLRASPAFTSRDKL